MNDKSHLRNNLHGVSFKQELFFAIFSFHENIRDFPSFRRQSPEHIVVQNGIPYGISMYQVSQENSDYEHRDRKHHASLTQQSTPY